MPLKVPRPIAIERSATRELGCWYAALGETTAIPDFTPAEAALATVVSANATYVVHWPEQQGSSATIRCNSVTVVDH
jgi:hypothetical protein